MIELLTLDILLAVGGAYLWPLIREWYYHLWDEERFIVAQDEAEYQAAVRERIKKSISLYEGL